MFASLAGSVLLEVVVGWEQLRETLADLAYHHHGQLRCAGTQVCRERPQDLRPDATRPRCSCRLELRIHPAQPYRRAWDQKTDRALRSTQLTAAAPGSDIGAGVPLSLSS